MRRARIITSGLWSHPRIDSVNALAENRSMTHSSKSKVSAWLRLSLLLILALVIASCRPAPVSPFAGRTVLYYVDSVVGTDAALVSLEAAEAQNGLTLVVTDDVEFENDLAAGPDLVVYFRQDGVDFPGGHLQALLDWVADGGHLVFTHWDMGIAAQSLANALESGFDFTENYDAMLVTGASLAGGLSSTTIDLTNAGWGTYNVGLTTSGSATAMALYEGTAVPAIVRGNGGQTYMVGYLNDAVSTTDGSRLYTNIFRAALEHLALVE